MMDQPDSDLRFMSRALELASQAEARGEVPVGAVLVIDDQIVGEGANAPINSNDVTAHAEIIALRMACSAQANYRLPNSTLYVTLEPCSMCAGAIVHARVQRVVIATQEPRAGAAGSVFNLLENDQLNHRCAVEFGLLQQHSSDRLRAFFKAKREQVKQRKQQQKDDKDKSGEYTAL